MHALWIALYLMLADMASDLYVPGLPHIGVALGVADESLVHLSFSAYLFGVASSTMFLGCLSDIHGRRIVWLIGNLLFFGGSSICVLSNSIYPLIAGRFVQGLGGQLQWQLVMLAFLISIRDGPCAQKSFPALTWWLYCPR